jgi:hypothetical protein
LTTPQSYLDAKELGGNPHQVVISAFASADQDNPMLVQSTKLDETIRAIDPEVADNFQVAVMTSRLAAMRPDLKFSVHLVVMLASISDRVGVVVCWAYTLVDFHRRHNRPMRVADWCEVFEDGLPTESEMHRLWDQQKVVRERGGSDNLIDDRDVWLDERTTVN